jgi:DNA-directed RNA polymerase subunit L
MIFYNLEKNNNKISFVLTDIDVSILNSVRRTILANIPNVGFHFNPQNYHEYPNIKIIKNDTPSHNEIIAHRISLLPINVSEQELESWNYEDYKFIIKKINKNNNDLHVTTNDISVYYKGEKNEELKNRFFPRNSFTKDHIIISKLNNTIDSEFNVEAIATIGTAEELALYGLVSMCTYENVIDDELVKKKIKDIKEKTKTKIIDTETEKIKDLVKDHVSEDKIKELLTNNYDNFKNKISKLLPKDFNLDIKLPNIDNVIENNINKFNTLDIYKQYHKNKYNEPNKFKFTVESECAISPIYIVNKALLIILNKINNIIQNIDDIQIIKNNDLFTVILNGETHTIGNLIQSLIFNKFIREEKSKELMYVGYTVPHPLEKVLLIKIKGNFTDPKNFFNKALIHVENTIEEVYNQWNTFSS